MAKFINKKEQVYDLKLTAYGRYLISIGQFVPEYYAFFDDNILYDSNYAGFPETQNHTEERILDKTQYLESLVLFEDLDSTILIEELLDLNNLATTPTKIVPRKDVFRLVEPIGDAYLDGESQAAPAWKIAALNGYITSSHFEDVHNRSKIPQVNIDLNYKKVVIDYELDPDDDRNTFENPKDIFDVVNSTSMFVDNKVIKLKTDNGMFYVDEVNTEILNENFELEVFKIVEIKCKVADAVIRIGVKTTGGGQYQLQNNDSITVSDGKVTRTYVWKTSPDSENDCELELYTGTQARTNAHMNSTRLEERILGTDGRTGCMCENFKKRSTQTGGTSSKGYRWFRLEVKDCGEHGNTEIIYDSQNPKVFESSDTSFTGGKNSEHELEKKYFKRENPQVVDGFMVSNEPEINPLQYYNTSSVEYYFNVLIDSEVPEDEACKASEIFNKQSYYVDLDFDCERAQEENVFYDIYGPATEPDICETS